VAVGAESGTWHYGLIARWWAEFNVAEPEELAYFRAAIRRFGEPALDLGCGTGRILMPLLADGLDVDGSDISADMIAAAEAQAMKHGFTPRLTVQPMHELDLARMYRTIYMCGSFGIGGRRDHDREALRRAYRHLEPGGALLVTNHEFPYAGREEKGWARWLPGHRVDIPREWPTEGERRGASDGDEIELLSRLAELDPLEQRHTLEIRARLWRGGQIVREEAHSLKESLYFAQEILLLLDEAGFRDLAVEGGYTGRPATADDGMVAFMARR
jgi:SAM-dependent methyltransferase